MATVGATLHPASVLAGPRAPRRLGPRSGRLGWILLGCIALPCFLSLPWSIQRFNDIRLDDTAGLLAAPSLAEPMGTDALGRPLLWRCLLGGAISLGIGIAAATLAVGIGVSVGMISGYAGGAIDVGVMRSVDVLYGLPYILLVVLIDLALDPFFSRWLGETWAGLVTLLIAIGGVSWLTMARVIRGQVLSLRAQPFVEAARALGVGPVGVMRRHLLPNLVGPIIVYSTLAVPAAILQESFLSFLGIGVRPPLPSWGNLAAEGVGQLPSLSSPDLPTHWWLLVFPCVLLGLTLMALNFLGDALRERLDPKGRRQ